MPGYRRRLIREFVLERKVSMIGWGWRLLRLAAILQVVLLPLTGEAWAERRVALVIGNGAYEHAPALRNPGNDADGMAALLGTLGFEVESGRDLGRAAMETLIRRFGRAATGADVALVFYAGHGLQVDGDNWLLPVDTRLEDVRDLEFEAVNLTTVLRQVEGSSARIVMLDACRDNPLASQMQMAGATRSVGRGLARVEAADVGTLIAFATSPGSTAADGKGRHSPFTAALLKHLGEPGLEIRQTMTRVRQAVVTASNGRQTPWENASLTGDLYLAGLPQAAEKAPLAPPETISQAAPFDERQIELAFWSSIEDSSKSDDFKAYLDRYPDGAFAQLARNRLAALQASTEPAESSLADKPNSTPDPRELARMLQVELLRVGCNPGTPDGEWGAKSRRALERFNREADTNLRTQSASAEALEVVGAHGKVCSAAVQKAQKPAAPVTKQPAARAAQRPVATAAKPSFPKLRPCIGSERRVNTQVVHSCSND